jgi:hypothetical protein
LIVFTNLENFLAPKLDRERPATERNRANTYNTRPGSAHWLLFGDEQDGARQSNIPDLNSDILEEIQITQNAPAM